MYKVYPSLFLGTSQWEWVSLTFTRSTSFLTGQHLNDFIQHCHLYGAWVWNHDYFEQAAVLHIVLGSNQLASRATRTKFWPVLGNGPATAVHPQKEAGTARLFTMFLNFQRQSCQTKYEKISCNQPKSCEPLISRPVLKENTERIAKLFLLNPIDYW